MSDLEKAAYGLGKPLISVKSNLRGVGFSHRLSKLDAADMAFSARPHLSEQIWRSIWAELLRAVQKAGKDPELERGIERILREEGAS